MTWTLVIWALKFSWTGQISGIATEAECQKVAHAMREPFGATCYPEKKSVVSGVGSFLWAPANDTQTLEYRLDPRNQP